MSKFCVTEGTYITLENGSKKTIEEIIIGENLLVYDLETLQKSQKYEILLKLITNNFKGIFTNSLVKNIWTNSVNKYYLINNKLKITGDHIILASRDNSYYWTKVENLLLNDELFTELNTFEKILSIEIISEKIDVYNLEVNTHYNYFANSYLIHNGGPCSACLNCGVNGQILYVDPSDNPITFTVPLTVTNISAAVVGGGGGGGSGIRTANPVTFKNGSGGGGGGLSYAESITVTPGEELIINVGEGGGDQSGGGYSSIKRGDVFLLQGNGGNAGSTTGTTPAGGTGGTAGGTERTASLFSMLMGRGGSGGVGGTWNGDLNDPDEFINRGGGGGAGGYTGNGGAGSGTAHPLGAPTGGGGGGGGKLSGDGGGVGIILQGDSGGSTLSNGDGDPGSNGNGKTYGGGGHGGKYGSDTNGSNGGVGAVRIIWSGNGRKYPSTNTSDM